MELPIFQVDAFSDRCFGGNPAAVCVVDEWPEDALMQAIAEENNLAETAFCTKEREVGERGMLQYAKARLRAAKAWKSLVHFIAVSIYRHFF